MKVVERELLPTHNCPYCDRFQIDLGEPGEEYECIECGKIYILGDC